jgi:hypothetical protein
MDSQWILDDFTSRVSSVCYLNWMIFMFAGRAACAENPYLSPSKFFFGLISTYYLQLPKLDGYL